MAAAVLTSSGVPYALSFLRRTNGALSIRCKALLGPLSADKAKEPIALTYANLEARSIERERDPEWTTRRLIERWKWHNDVRTAVLIVGTVVGAAAVALA